MAKDTLQGRETESKWKSITNMQDFSQVVSLSYNRLLLVQIWLEKAHVIKYLLHQSIYPQQGITIGVEAVCDGMFVCLSFFIFIFF